MLVGSWLTGVNLFEVVGGGGATDVVADRPVDRIAGRRTARRFRRCGDGRHSAHVVAEARQLSADARRALPRLHPVGVRAFELGHWPVLLPGRPQGLSRPQLLQRSPSETRRAWRFRAGLCPGARGGASRAEPHRHARKRRRSAEAQTSTQCASNCRPTVMPACGDTKRQSPGVSRQDVSSWIPAMPKKG